jgi:hypothetical protein
VPVAGVFFLRRGRRDTEIAEKDRRAFGAEWVRSRFKIAMNAPLGPVAAPAPEAPETFSAFSKSLRSLR